MDLTKYQHSDSVVVDAPPEAVYALVADVTRIGEFSPICKSAQWNDDERTSFTGNNVNPDREWSTHCRVDVAAPGHEFTFTNRGVDDADDFVQWSYTFAPRGGGTEVTETWQVLPGFVDQVQSMAPDVDIAQILDGMVPGTQQGIAATLANVKAVAER
jgi:ribosome-associated toxin RatA of RatAB toxin-antitoxin module